MAKNLLLKNSRPELNAPAGCWASLAAAVEGGADAVYFGVAGINMRHMAENFQLNELAKVMAFLKDHGKKGYLTLNTVILPADLPRARRVLERAKAAGVDAVILWDLAVLKMAREIGIPIHLSTQASAASIGAVQMYARLGARQIVLARECTLQDIRRITRQITEEKIRCRIEVFVHGAMCVSVSGRCFLSQETFGLSANQGKCLQPCRREYLIRDLDGECEYILGRDYMMSPRDLCTIGFMDKLIRAGVSSFKIEGRMRSPEYVRVACACYRQAIDAYFRQELTAELKARLTTELASVYNRGFSTGFYLGPPDDGAWSRGLEHTHEKVFVGDVTRFFKKISVAEIRLRSGKVAKGDTLLFIGEKTPALMCTADEMQKEQRFVESAGKGDIIGLKVPFVLRPKDKVFLWKERAGEERGTGKRQKTKAGAGA